MFRKLCPTGTLTGKAKVKNQTERPAPKRKKKINGKICFGEQTCQTDIRNLTERLVWERRLVN